jgi:DNA primase
MATPESTRLTAAYLNFHAQMLRLFRVRTIVRAAVSKGKQDVTQKLMGEVAVMPTLLGANGAIGNIPEWVKELKQAMETPALKKQIEETCDKTVDGCLIPLDSALLVFAHSLLDVVLQECICVSAIAKRSDWLKYLSERKITLAEFEAKGLKDIQNDLLNQHINTVSRESLLKRSDILHAVSRPSDASLSENIFSREQLENIDKLRHEIVHKLEFHKEITNIGDILASIQKMGVYFVILVGTTHSILMCKDAKELVPHLNPDLGKLVTAISDFNDLKKQTNESHP